MSATLARVGRAPAPVGTSSFSATRPVPLPKPALSLKPAPSSTSSKAAPSPKPVPSRKSAPAAKPEQEILFQNYFKSVGPRTYAAQVKKAGNGNHFLVLTE